MLKPVNQKILAETKINSADQNANDNQGRLPDLQFKVIESKAMSDLEWQIKFTEQKLRQWKGLDNDQWVHLDKLHKKAKINYRELHDYALAELHEITNKTLLLRAF